MGSSTPDEHLDRMASLEQELDELYGHLGLPKPKFGELSVRRLPAKRTKATESEHRVPGRALRRTS